MKITRRKLIKITGLSMLAAFYQNSLLGAINFAPKQPMPRMPLDEFVKDPKLLAALRLGVKEMKKRKPSDPLSWFYQAAIHGITDEAFKEAQKIDSNVTEELRKKIWNQCPHNGQNSANFLPWHRAYTYHFEKILRLHTGMDDFSIPYWNYIDLSDEEKRMFPKEFGIKHLDGNQNNESDENINPLYLEERDWFFAKYEYPIPAPLPLLSLSKKAVDISQPLGSPVFFGETESEGIGGGIVDSEPSTRGLLEKYPHDQIHRAVGGIVKTPNTPIDSESVGAMANPPTAAFDPIFPIHHSTIDWIWVQWECMPGKSWGKLPDDSWFNEKAWWFVETDGSLVNQPRKFYFDHRALNTSYKYEDLSIQPLQLPSISLALVESAFKSVKAKQKLVAKNDSEIKVSKESRSITPIPQSVRKNLKTEIASNVIGDGQKKLLLKFTNVELGKLDGTGFEIYLTNKPNNEFLQSDNAFIGSIVLFSHNHNEMMPSGHNHMNHDMPMNSQIFNATKAIKSIDNLDDLSVVIIPFSLYDGKRQETITAPLVIKGIEFILQN